MFELARVTFSYGESKNAYLNPATPLHSMECADYVSAKLTQSKLTQSIYSIIYSILRQGIKFVFSENGDTINSAVAICFLPGGYRGSYDGAFRYIGYYGIFWSSTEGSTGYAWTRALNYVSAKVYRYNYGGQSGFSVRCVRDLKFKIISLFSFLYKV